MELEGRLIGKKVSLTTCTEEYVTEEYAAWLNDPQINQFLETRYEEQTLEKVESYVKRCLKSKDEILLAMIESNTHKHVGNIHLTFNRIHKRCFFGYFIGNQEFWGRGIAVEAIKLASRWAFETSDIARMDGGLYSRNIFSLKTVVKAGFRKEAVLEDYLTWKDGRRDDNILVVLSREDYEKQRALEEEGM